MVSIVSPYKDGSKIPEPVKSNLTIETETQAKGNRVALKWAEKHARGELQCWDWDLAALNVPVVMRDVSLVYIIFQACLEMSREEYARGWNDCLERQKYFNHKIQSK